MISNIRVRLLKDIYDDGQDHHPPCYVGHKGDIVVIHSVQTAVVSHDGTGDGFIVHDGELDLSAALDNLIPESYTVAALQARFADKSMPWTRWHVAELIQMIGTLTTQRGDLSAENTALRNLANNLQPGPISQALGGVEHEKPFRLAAGFEQASSSDRKGCKGCGHVPAEGQSLCTSGFCLVCEIL
jgi:hypothetical protein